MSGYPSEDYSSDSDINIVHITDLHFGMKNQDTTWKVLANFIKNDLRPELILITGDIADSPNAKYYEKAKDALDDLKQSYLVCPGNHDRHFRGNIWPFGIGKWFRGKNAGSIFDQVFQGVICTPHAPIDRNVTRRNNSWDLRLLGIDSSLNADRYARGYADVDELQAIKTSMLAADEIDLSIVLVHHHPFPVRRLEAKSIGRFSSLLNATAMANAGTFLEALALHNVDVVLHGHEHMSNWACYRTLEGGRGQTNVLGAGSATGADTKRGCIQSSASFNVISLSEDRHVRVSVYEHDGERFRRRAPISVLGPTKVRKAGFLRRAKLHTSATSEVTKYVEFMRTRDIVIHERVTNWRLDKGAPNWRRIVKNTTGMPVDPLVEFKGPDGQLFIPDDLSFDYVKKPEDNAYVVECNVEEPLASLPLSIDLRYKWFGGGLLTEQEMNDVNRRNRGGLLRRDGFEYASVKSAAEVAHAELILRIAEEFAPKSGDVLVKVLTPGGESVFHEERDLQRRVRSFADSYFSVSIPYPRRDHRYILAWRPPRYQLPDVDVRSDVARLRKEAPRLIGGLRQDIQGYLPSMSSVAVYLPDEALEYLVLAAKEVVGGAAGPIGKLSAVGDESVVGQAWWGTINVGRLGDDVDALRAGYAAGEVVQVAVPLGGKLDDIVRGVLRIGFASLTPAEDRLLQPDGGTQLWPRLADSVLMMLYGVGQAS